jgi:hypothetical protein
MQLEALQLASLCKAVCFWLHQCAPMFLLLCYLVFCGSEQHMDCYCLVNGSLQALLG